MEFFEPIPRWNIEMFGIVPLAILIVIGIVLTIAIRRIIVKTRRKTSANYEPPVFQANQPIQSNQPSNFVPLEVVQASANGKRCPTCKSIYTDQSLAFCLSDGAPLESVFVAPPIDNLPVTKAFNEPFAPAPTVYAKNDADDLPATVQSPYFTPDDKDKI